MVLQRGHSFAHGLILLCACASSAPVSVTISGPEGTDIAVAAQGQIAAGAVFSWSQVSPRSPKGAFADAAAASTTWHAPAVCADAEFVLKLSVKEGGTESSQFFNVNVSDSTEAVMLDPAITFGSTTALPGEEVTVSIDARGPGCPSDNVQWTSTPPGVFSDDKEATTTWRSAVVSADTMVTIKVAIMGAERTGSVLVRTPTYADVEEIYSPQHARCYECHDGTGGQSGGFNLIGIDANRNARDNDCGSGRLVVPGDPAASVLIKRMRRNGCGSGPGARMPYDETDYFDRFPGGLVRIESWIAAGARF